MSEELRTSRVKVFCPRCEEVYIPKKKCPDVDGAYFGCSFPSIFLMVTTVIHLLEYARCERHAQQPNLRAPRVWLPPLQEEGISLPGPIEQGQRDYALQRRATKKTQRKE